MYYTSAIKSERAWLKSDQLTVLPGLTCEDLQAFINEFMSKLNMQVLVHGNLMSEGEDCTMLLLLLPDLFFGLVGMTKESGKRGNSLGLV